MEKAWQINLSPGLFKSSKPFKRYGVRHFHIWYNRIPSKNGMLRAHCRLADHKHATSTWRSMEKAWQIILSLGLLKSSKPFKRYGVRRFHVWYKPHTFEKRHVERLTAGWRIIDMRLPPGVQWRKHGRLF